MSASHYAYVSRVVRTLMAGRYEPCAMSLTRDFVFGEWDGIFKNLTTTAAAIDGAGPAAR